MGEQLPQEFGQYTLHELIGRGGMAEIYRASMPGIGGFEKTVAIKKILPHLAEDDEFTTMLIDEARIIESLDHSNIAQVFDLGKRDGTYYIAMEYIHGVDLSEMIDDLQRRGEQFPIPHVAHITSSVCAGLHFAHSKTDEEGNPLNVIHRDISPHNIRLSFAGEVKIIDFGVAKAADREAHTKMGVIKGKLLYMAPEQAKAEDLDGRADLFATGLCAYKMLTGRLPFDGENEFQIYNNILQKDIVPPRQIRPEVPEQLNHIVMKLLRRDPDERYQEGYAAKQDLDELLHEIAPGYTVNRLARFVEDNFSHLVQTDAEGAPTETSRPTDMAPSTPSRPAPGTGQREAAELDSTPDAGGGEPVRERVPADGSTEETVTATPSDISEDESQPPEPTGGRETRTDEGETGQYQSDSDGGLPRVVYAIGAVIVAIAGMVAWALVASDASAPDDSKAAADETEAAGTATPSLPSKAETVSISLDSKPSGAELVRMGEHIGTTPIVFDLPKTDRPIEVTLSKSGHRSTTIELVPEENLDRTVRLAAADAGLGRDADGTDGAPEEQPVAAGGAPGSADSERTERGGRSGQPEEESDPDRESESSGTGGAETADESGSAGSDDETETDSADRGETDESSTGGESGEEGTAESGGDTDDEPAETSDDSASSEGSGGKESSDESGSGEGDEDSDGDESGGEIMDPF